jgi:hypothetical protein
VVLDAATSARVDAELAKEAARAARDLKLA